MPSVPPFPMSDAIGKSKTAKTAIADPKQKTIAVCEEDAERTLADDKGKHESLSKGDDGAETKFSKYGQVHQGVYQISCQSHKSNRNSTQGNGMAHYRRRFVCGNH